MQKRYFYAVLATCLLVTSIKAQENRFENRVQQISENMEYITREEKRVLKQKVDVINDELQKGQITLDAATLAKEQAATYHAEHIEERINAEKKVLDQLVKEKVTAGLANANFRASEDSLDFDSIRSREVKVKLIEERPWKRTTSQVVFAMGMNNLVTNGAVANSDFRYLGSHFYEFGWTYTTRLFKDDNLLHLKYGLSMMYNNLRPTDNRYFVNNSKQTELAISDKNLNESRLRNLNLVVPLHLEFDFTPTRWSADGSQMSIPNKRGFRIGVGGYAGFNVKTKQILKYNEDGEKYKVKSKNDFRTNDFVYGASAYIGYRSFSLYSKYDISPLFKSNEIDQNNISVGIRADFN